VLLTQRAAKDAVKEVEESLTWSQRFAEKIAELNGYHDTVRSVIAGGSGFPLTSGLHTTKRAARFRVADVDGDPPFLGVRRERGRPSSVRSPVFPPAAGNKNSRGALPGK
jgi:hypothetical protein